MSMLYLRFCICIFSCTILNAMASDCSEAFSQHEKPKKILMLIASSDDLPVYAELHKIWRAYMRLCPDQVEAYFVKSNPNLETSCQLIEDTLWTKTHENFSPGMITKTLLAMEYMLPRLNEFEYVVRTNLSSFYVFPRLIKYLETLPKTGCYAGHIDYGCYANYIDPGNQEKCCSRWGCGAGLYFSPDVVELFVKNKDRILNDRLAYVTFDDVFIAYFLQNHHVQLISAPRWDWFGTKEEWLFQKPEIPENAFHFRIKQLDPSLRKANDPFILSQLFKTFYPTSTLPDIDLSPSEPQSLIAQLSKNLKENPNNENLIFQLAEAHYAQQQNGEAINHYKARIDKGGNREEVWASTYRIGEIYDRIGYWDLAFQWYLKAYQESPDRAEPLLKIARHYRLLGQNNLAYLYAKQGSRIPTPHENSLCFSPSVYDYELDEELSIVSFYTPYKEEGRKAAERLILKRRIPHSLKEQTYKNMVHYAPLLTEAKFEVIENHKHVKTDNEQNLYFHKDNELFTLNSFDPLTIDRIDDTGHHQIVSYIPSQDLSKLRWSVSPIPFDQGYLLVVHEVVFDQKAYYMHRFLKLDKDFKIKSLSKPFFFKQKSVEYCSGMTIDHTGKNLILTLGVEDREAYFVTISLDNVNLILSQ